MPPICNYCGLPVNDGDGVECPICHEVDHKIHAMEAAESFLSSHNIRVNFNGPIAMCSHGHLFNPDTGEIININIDAGQIEIEQLPPPPPPPPPPILPPQPQPRAIGREAFLYYVILTPLSLAALSLLYLRVMPYLIAVRAFVFLSSLLTFFLAARLIDIDSNVPWIIPLLGELMLMPIMSNTELTALAWSSIVLTSILLPAVAARRFENASVGCIERLALMIVAIADALPGIALGQLYYVTLTHFGPGSPVARALSAILLIALIILLPRVGPFRILRISNDNLKGLLALMIIFMLIIIVLVPAYILEVMTWLAIATITIMIVRIALGFLRNRESIEDVIL